MAWFVFILSPGISVYRALFCDRTLPEQFHKFLKPTFFFCQFPVPPSFPNRIIACTAGFFYVYSMYTLTFDSASKFGSPSTRDLKEFLSPPCNYNIYIMRWEHSKSNVICREQTLPPLFPWMFNEFIVTGSVWGRAVSVNKSNYAKSCEVVWLSVDELDCRQYDGTFSWQVSCLKIM